MLEGTRVVSLAINLPGPLAAARLASMGADVTKVEPPSGDPLASMVPDYYAELVAAQQVLTIDLKTDDGRAQLAELLTDADLLLTAQRPSALARLGLDDLDLPQLCQVRIVGHSDDPEVGGHDLTYQAAAGLLRPPALPSVLVADVLGAERAVSTALGALVQRSLTGHGGTHMAGLDEAGAFAAGPNRHGMIDPASPISGGWARYNLYRASDDGWVALAALEQHFWKRFADAFDCAEEYADVASVMATKTVAGWVDWGNEHDVPIAAVKR